MRGFLVLTLVAASFVLIGASKGAAMALSYLGLSIGLSIAAIFFSLAFRIWRGRP